MTTLSRDEPLFRALWMATIAGNIGCFTSTSWLEHLRQHKRMTATDHDIEVRAWACQQGEPYRSSPTASPTRRFLMR